MKEIVVNEYRLWRAAPLPDRAIVITNNTQLGDDGGREIARYYHPVQNWHYPGATDGVHAHIVSYQGKFYLAQASFYAPTRGRWQHHATARFEKGEFDQALEWMRQEVQRLERMLMRVRSMTFDVHAKEARALGDWPDYTLELIASLPPTPGRRANEGAL